MSDLGDYKFQYRQWHSGSQVDIEQSVHWSSEWLKDYIDSSATSHPVLDVGCGFGFGMLALRKLGFSTVAGFEISESQVEKARVHGLEVVHGDSATDYLKQFNGHFGTIVLSDVLEHVPKHQQITLLGAIKQALRPCGRLIISVPNADSPLAMRWMFNDLTHDFCYTKSSLLYVLLNAGFEQIHLDGQVPLGKFPWRMLRYRQWDRVRSWLVRWAWLQCYKAEVPFEDLSQISFELNLRGYAIA